MARKSKNVDELLESGTKKKGSLFDIIKKVDDSAEILKESAMANIKDWISTGSYILNACVSGSLFGGIPSGRVITLAGSSGCGKSYLACSICREAQKKNYDIVYLDSENAIDTTFVERLGCDSSRFIIKQVSTVNEASSFILNLCKNYQDAIKAGEELNPFVIVIDSLGMMASSKELTDAMQDKHVQDFTRSKEIKKLFRLITVEIAKCHAPLIVVNHTYTNAMSFIPTESMSGGSGIEYAGTVTLFMRGSKLDDKENDKAAEKRIGAETIKRTGIKVTCYPEKSRLSIAHKVAFQIPLYKKPNPFTGLEMFLNWENAGIMLGKCYNEQEYLKLKPAEQMECTEFDFNGEKRYAQPKKSLTRGVGLVCKHLGCALPPTEFWSEKCFTEEYLHFIDDNIIRPEFELPNRDSFNDVDELAKELGLDDVVEND